MASLPSTQSSNPRQRTRSGCYTCKVRKVKCKSEIQDRSADSDEIYSCNCCKRLGLECRWTVPVAGEDYTPPPKRRQTIGRRRERAQNSVANDKVAIASHADDSQASRPREDPDTHAEQSGSRLARTPPFELDAYVDMLGDLPFNTDFALDLDPAVLGFNGEGLGFGPPPTFDSLFSLPAGRSGNSRSLSNCTDPRFPQPPSNSHSHKHTSGADASVSWEISNLGADEHHLIQHYLAAMTGYAKVDDYPRTSNNLYTTAFSQSLFFKPLLYAILAFSASHLALEDGRYLEKASKYEQLAHDSFEACREHGAEPDSLLCALFVRAKRVHLTAGNIESFHSLIIEATEIILSEKGQQVLQDPFSLAQRIIIRLALLDARASCYRLGGGTLIKALRHTPAMSYIFNPESHDRLAPNALVSLLRADILRMKVSEIDLRLRFQTESEELIPLPVRTDELLSLQKHVEQEIRQLEYQMSSRGHDPDDVTQAECVLEPSTYAQYLVMAALHSTILYLYMDTLGVSQSAQVKWLGPLACWADNRITSHKDYGKSDPPPVLDFGANEDPTKSQKSLIDAPPVPTASHDNPDTSAAKAILGMKDSEVQDVQLEEPEELVEYTEDEEKRVLRKLDFILLPLLCLCYVFSFLDKTLLNYSSIFGLKKALHLEGTDYSWLGSAFYLGYMAGSMVWAKLVQRWPAHAGKFITGAVLAWSSITLLTPLCYNFSGILAVRVCLGLVESIIGPVFVIVTSNWWTRQEQTFRTAFWLGGTPIGNFLGGLISYAIGSVHSSVSTWKLFFVFFGALSFGFAIILVVFMPDNQSNARWLTEKEKKIALERVRENQTVSSDNHWKWNQFWEALRDPQTAFFFVTAVGNTMPSTFASQAGRLAGYYLTYTHTMSFTLNTGLMASNYAGNTKKSAANGVIFAGWAAGLVAGPQFFLESQAPVYDLAFKMLMGCYALMIIVPICQLAWYSYENKRRNRLVADQGDHPAPHTLEFSDKSDFERWQTFRYAM
ncbi:hypothetical protein PENOC_033990 [Penicillium occitanis (nom. inval.)]|nr:hypothetical protein PENOC_033990 [Penicillium occitanis (nom. inval.)]